MLALLIIAHMVWQSWYVILHRNPGMTVKCRYIDGVWCLIDCMHNELIVTLQSDTVISPIMIILNFYAPDQNKLKTVLIFRDAVSKLNWKTLRRQLIADKSE